MSRQSAGRRVDSSFTIKNILNLPDDTDESTEPISQGLRFDVASLPPHQLTNGSPPLNCWPFRPWIVSRFTAQFSPRGLGGTGFARDADFLGDHNSGLKLRGRRMRKKKKRPLFSTRQVLTMEKEFDSKKYLTEGKKAELAVELELTETQVKTWFQNRRTRWRKELKNKNPPVIIPDGRLKHSLEARKFS